MDVRCPSPVSLLTAGFNSWIVFIPPLGQLSENRVGSKVYK